MASIVIPAHNEEAVIGRCLDVLLREADPGEFEVIVACNGCTDGTAEIARSQHPGVTVIESDTASKVAALNAGDRAASRFPRLYVDADVELPTRSARALTALLADRDGPLAAAPRLEVDLTRVSRPVRAYYRVWTRLSYVQEHMLGSGVYALSAEGRARFALFPDGVGDDHFISVLFAPGERATVDEPFVVHPPRTLSSVVRVRVRVFALAYALRAQWGSAAGEPHRRGSGISHLLRREPRMAPSIAMYVAVQGYIKLRGRWRARQGELQWERDDTARVAGSA